MNPTAGLLDYALRPPESKPPSCALTAEGMTAVWRHVAAEPLFRPDPPELRSPDEVAWRRARPGSTHFDYALAMNPQLRRRWNDRWRAYRRSRRNQPPTLR